MSDALERAKDMLFAMERGERNLKLDGRILEEMLGQGKPPRGWDVIPNVVDETLLEPAVQRQILTDLIRAYETQQAELERLLETLLAASPSLHAEYISSLSDRPQCHGKEFKQFLRAGD